MSVLLSTKEFEFCERLTPLGIQFCCLIDEFLIASSCPLRSLDGFWVFSKEI
jgi:hypothetical protein